MTYKTAEKTGFDLKGNKKQRLSLSAYAEETINNDMYAFGRDKREGFLNTILRNYRDDAASSISLRLGELKNELEISLQDIGLDDRMKRKVITRLYEERKDQLIAAMPAYEKTYSLLFNLNKDNAEYLEECREHLYYKKRADYIKNVIEEYARQAYVKREQIIFQNEIAEIKKAIYDRSQLKVTVAAGSTYSVYPYGIMQDPLATSNYLVGYCSLYDSGYAKYPCSFKVASMRSVKAEKSKRSVLTGKEITDLKKKISVRGVQFLVGKETEIRLRMTKAGIFRYRKYTNLRPPLKEKTDDEIFVFECTETQAEAYFFKFGKDVEIISPVSLRERFKNEYEHAAEQYR